MRRISILLLVSLLASSAAVAAVAAVDGFAASGDGSLVVSGANARLVTVQGNGLIFGHITQGTLTIVEYTPSSGSTVQVSGSMMKLPFGSTLRYAGSDVRFAFPNGRYTLRLDGFGIDVSAVGRGQVSATGIGTSDNGTLATNGGKPLPLGPASITLTFGNNKGSNAASATGGKGQSR